MASHSSSPPTTPAAIPVGPQGAESTSASVSPAPMSAAVGPEPRAVIGATQSHNTHLPPFTQPPPLPSVTSGTATPPSAFRYPPRLARTHSASAISLTAGRTTPDYTHYRHALGPEYSSTSSLETTASSSAFRGRPHGRAVQGSPSSSMRRSIRGVQRYPDYEEDRRDDEDEDRRYTRQTSEASDADSERSIPQAELSQPSTAGTIEAGGREGLLIPVGESFHAKKKRTRVLPTAHQSSELNKLLAETPFPSTARREELGRRIGLSARKVQVWFQNRRQKARRAKEEMSLKQTSDNVPKRESPSVSPTSPVAYTRLSSRPFSAHPPSAWVAPPAVAGPSTLPARGLPSRPFSSEVSVGEASYPSAFPAQGTGFTPAIGHDSRAPAGHPVDVVHSPTTPARGGRPVSWQDPREPGYQSYAAPLARDDRRGTRSHERIRSLDRITGPDTYSPPPSSYHPYGSRSHAGRPRRSPSLRRARSREDLATTQVYAARPASPLSYSYDQEDLRLPPLILPADVPPSPASSREFDQLSYPRAQQSSEHPTTPASPSRAFPAFPAAEPHSGLPPPITLQPQPLWENPRALAPDFFNPRRMSLPVGAFVRQRRDGNAPRPDGPLIDSRAGPPQEGTDRREDALSGVVRNPVPPRNASRPPSSQSRR